MAPYTQPDQGGGPQNANALPHVRQFVPPSGGPVPNNWWMQRYGQQPQQPQQPTTTAPGTRIPMTMQPAPGQVQPQAQKVPPTPGQQQPPPGQPAQPPAQQTPNQFSGTGVGDPWGSPFVNAQAQQLYTSPQGYTTVNPIPGYMPQNTQVQGPVDPTYAQMSWNNGGPSTQQVTQNIMSSLQPQFQMQNLALNEQLADAGIVGGSAPGAQAQLGLQQQTQAMGDIAPYIMQGYQMNQQGDLANQNWMNQLQEFNSQQSTGAQEFGQNLFQNNQEFNANQFNQAGQFDIDNMLRQSMYNAGVFNTGYQEGAQLQNTDWLAQLQANTALQEAGMGVQAGAFQPVFTQPSPVDFGGLAQGLAPGGGYSPVNGTAPASYPGGVWG